MCLEIAVTILVGFAPKSFLCSVWKFTGRNCCYCLCWWCTYHDCNKHL